MRPRIEQELALLREHFPAIVHLEHGGEDWFLIPDYPFPPGWDCNGSAVTTGPIVFKVSAAYPSAEPYGFATTFATSAGLTYRGTPPDNTAVFAAPFAGTWLLFSWAPDGDWRPTNDVRKGSNLYAWVRSFRQRLAAGK